MIKLEENFLRGSYPPVITPFLEDGDVDYDSYRKLIEFQIAGGSHGIVVNGTSSEPSVLTMEERKRLLEVAIEAVAGRLPVVAATGSQSHAETVELTEHALAHNVDALMVVTPYYIRPPQRGLVAFYNDICKRAGNTPVLMYHIPGRAAITVTMDTLKAIAAESPNFIGMKHATPELSLVTDALAEFGPEFRIFVGLEELSFPMMAIGAAGMVNAVSNVAPRAVSELYEAVARGDLTEGRRLHFALFDLNRAVFYDTNPIPMKYMAKQLGILPANTHRLPMMPATPEVEKKLDKVLAEARTILN